MNKKLYLIIQVLVIILTFFISSVCAKLTVADLKQETLETCTSEETLSTENNLPSTEPQVTDLPAHSNTEQTEGHQETQPTQTTEENSEPPPTLETPDSSQTQPSETEAAPIETQSNFNWYYAYNTNELEIRDENDEVINTMPMYSVFKVLWVYEEKPSLIYINWEGCVGYVSANECINEIPDIIELGCYFARTLCDLNLRDVEGELIEIIPVNSLVYVLGTSSNEYDRATIINMSNGNVGTIVYGEVEYVEDAICVSIDYQNVTLLIDGKIIVRGNCVTGTSNRRDTPRGAFSVLNKDPNVTLTDNKTYSQKVDYWIRFYKGCGFHDANWRSRFGGTIYIYDGSHGCVNCPYDLAKTLYEYAYVGMPVYVA